MNPGRNDQVVLGTEPLDAERLKFPRDAGHSLTRFQHAPSSSHPPLRLDGGDFEYMPDVNGTFAAKPRVRPTFATPSS